ncbi:S-layer homology domain-containing protein [Peptoniphilus catoniae]|uniref:S-layer homology domain-containing protein n=1 Tax=Peptoniphilus catoniae TaxID=1660341 RepID=UPI0010FEDB74|nr:S-layer homology domain-containing protein [Peptoniphilus catoniae]
MKKLYFLFIVSLILNLSLSGNVLGRDLYVEGELKSGDYRIKASTDIPYTEVTLKDQNDKLIGEAVADKEGSFYMDLTRQLVAGEDLYFHLLYNDFEEIFTYKVKLSEIGNLTRPAYIKGYEDGSFKPDKEVTRAEVCAMFSKLINGSEDFGTSDITKFIDANEEWYSPYINYMVSKDLIKGYPDGRFKAENFISRGEFAQVAANYLNEDKKFSSGFKDVEDYWAKDAIDLLVANNIVKGYPDGSFKPENKITRAEAVKILNAVFSRYSTEDSFKNFSGRIKLNRFNDIDEKAWYYADIIDASVAHNSYRISEEDKREIWTDILDN